jgi:hypothetical protein
MSKADDFLSTINDVNRILKNVFGTESKQNAWYYYPVSALDGLIPATLMRKSLADANKVYSVLRKMEKERNGEN